MSAGILLGAVSGVAWLGLVVSLPVIRIRQAGSLRAWAQRLRAAPFATVAKIHFVLGAGALCVWLLSEGRVPWRWGVGLVGLGACVSRLGDQFRLGSTWKWGDDNRRPRP